VTSRVTNCANSSQLAGNVVAVLSLQPRTSTTMAVMQAGDRREQLSCYTAFASTLSPHDHSRHSLPQYRADSDEAPRSGSWKGNAPRLPTIWSEDEAAGPSVRCTLPLAHHVPFIVEYANQWRARGLSRKARAATAPTVRVTNPVVRHFRPAYSSILISSRA